MYQYNPFIVYDKENYVEIWRESDLEPKIQIRMMYGLQKIC